MQKIYSPMNITEAHIVKGLLEQHGIAAHIGGQYLQGAIGELPPFDLLSVNVEEHNYAPALDIIAEYENATPELPVSELPQNAMHQDSMRNNPHDARHAKTEHNEWALEDKQSRSEPAPGQRQAAEWITLATRFVIGGTAAFAVLMLLSNC